MIASEATIKEKPRLVQGFLRASIRGWREALRDPKAGVDAVMAVAPTLDRAAQEFMLTEAGKLMVAGQAGRTGCSGSTTPP